MCLTSLPGVVRLIPRASDFRRLFCRFRAPGRLVEAGRQIARHLKAAIDLGRLCSNDPVCAQHAAENQHECRFLNGASCHGCLLIAETLCEQHNDFLDQALVISTVDSNGAEFFG